MIQNRAGPCSEVGEHDEREVTAAVRLKLLLVTRNLPPLVGGMERFNERVIAELAKEFEVAVCGPEGCEEFLPAGIRVMSMPVRSLPLFLLRMVFASLVMARSFRPDVVIAGSGLTAPMALLAGRYLRKPVLVFLYGLDLVVANRLYQWLWIPAIRACDGFLAISRHTRDLAFAKNLNASKIQIISPGVDRVSFDHRDRDVGEFRRLHGIGNRPIMLSVGRLTKRKGVTEFIRSALAEIVRRQPDSLLVVVGGEASDALSGNSGGISNEARNIARKLGLERNLLLLGSVSDSTVRAAYMASQVHVFSVIDIPGDVEGFGIVALEAAIAGIPTVAFSVGGVVDAVAHDISGVLVSPGDYPTMIDAVARFLEGGDGIWNDRRRQACMEFASAFEWDKIGVRLNKAVLSIARDQ